LSEYDRCLTTKTKSQSEKKMHTLWYINSQEKLEKLVPSDVRF